jgi:hypothetical protein
MSEVRGKVRDKGMGPDFPAPFPRKSRKGPNFKGAGKMMKSKFGLMLICVLTAGSALAAESVLILRVSTPLIASGSAGLRLGGRDDGLQPVAQVEAGVGGGKVAVGLDSLGRKNLGYGIKAALLRTWFEPIEVDEDQTFLGLEGELSVKQLVFNLGGYRRVSDGDDEWLVSAGIGFLF